MNSEKIIISLLGLTLILAAGNFALSITKSPTNSIDNKISANTDDESQKSTSQQVPDQQNAVKTTATFSEFGLTFEYPLGWHMYVQNIFDDSSRTKPLHNIFLNDAPITLTSPSGGPGMWAKITMRSLDEGEARYAPYENGPWKEYLTDEIIINGQKATRLRITASDDAVYVTPYQEVIFMGGYEIVYQAHSKEEAMNDPAWKLIQNSIRID